MLGLFINKYMDASHLRYNATILRYFVNKYMDASLMIALMIACDSHMIAWTNICLDWIEMVENLTSQKEFILEDILNILQIYLRFQRFNRKIFDSFVLSLPSAISRFFQKHNHIGPAN